ncbi:MAG: YfbM family protein [Labilithrix sp.]|nr:YfbM family protein [Labilithrix sp.]
MACRGVHFAIRAEQAERLLAAEDDDELLAIVEEIEEEWESAFESDKAWDALHRCLSSGTLDVSEGEPPLNRAFFGGRVLNREADYFVVLVVPEEVREVAGALAKVTEEWLRRRYFDVPFPDYQSEKSEEDCAYALSNFEGLPEFFARAAADGRYVIFTVDQ